MKIVINADAGKFGLSDQAFERYLAETNQVYTTDVIAGVKRYLNPDYHIIFAEEIPRDNLVLVQIVEELGTLANGPEAKLAVINLPDDVLEWELEEMRAGNEVIREKHRVFK
jgi:hypothetical protein